MMGCRFTETFVADADLTKEVVHEGGVVHGNLHLVIVLVTCLPETQFHPSGLIVLKVFIVGCG